MRTYLLLKERASAFRADPEVRQALDGAGVPDLAVPTLSPDETTADLLADRSVVTEAAIPSLAMIERMSVERTPVTAFAPRSQAARAYRALWSELRAEDI